MLHSYVLRGSIKHMWTLKKVQHFEWGIAIKTCDVIMFRILLTPTPTDLTEILCIWRKLRTFTPISNFLGNEPCKQLRINRITSHLYHASAQEGKTMVFVTLREGRKA